MLQHAVRLPQLQQQRAWRPPQSFGRWDAHFFENSNVVIPREGGGHKSSEILQYCLGQALAFYM